MANVNIATLIKRLLLPTVVAVGSGLIFFFAGDAYQAVGLAAFEHAQRIVSYGLGIAVFLSGAMLVERVMRLVVFDSIIAVGMGSPVPRLLKQMTSITIYLTACAAILAVVFKQDLTVLWAASGVAGIVLGMALKELLTDVISGLALNIDRPMKIGDYVKIHGSGDTAIEGSILEISWRTTSLADLSNNIVVVANNKMASATTTNFSQPTAYGEMKVSVSVDVSVPHERVLRILAAAATEAWPRFSVSGEPPPSVSLRAITQHAVDYDIFYFCDLGRRARGRNQILQHVLTHLRQAGLRPALPKLERVEAEGPIWRSVFPEPEEIECILAGCDGFRSLEPAAIKTLAGSARMRPVAAGQTVVQAGEAGDRAFIVVEGLMQSLPAKKGSQPLQLRPGHAFGLVVALTGEPYGATVRSVTECTLCELGIPDFQALFAAYPAAAQALGRQVATAMVRDMAKGRREDSGDADAEVIAGDVLRSMRRTYAGLPPS